LRRMPIARATQSRHASGSSTWIRASRGAHALGKVALTRVEAMWKMVIQVGA
jgi:hypothetical protein